MTVPTKAEIDAAREWLSDWRIEQLHDAGFDRTMGAVRVLLAALDAAERERYLETCRANVQMERAETAERERDEARAKLDGAIVVRDDEATREIVARAMLAAHAERYSLKAPPDRESVKASRQYADAVLAALREAPRG